MRYELTKKERIALEIGADRQLLDEIVERVLSKVSWSDRDKIDKLLFYDHELHGNLDVTNVKKDKRAVISKSKIIYRAIRTIDQSLGSLFLQHQDDV